LKEQAVAFGLGGDGRQELGERLLVAGLERGRGAEHPAKPAAAIDLGEELSRSGRVAGVAKRERVVDGLRRRARRA
jgi:hypothetical protein